MKISPAEKQRTQLVQRLTNAQVYQPREIVISQHKRCLPGRCAHCATGSRPNSTERLSRDQIVTLFEDLQESPIIAFAITGGEPLIDLEELLFTIRTGCSFDLAFSHINTNAVTADTLGQAYNILIRLATSASKPLAPFGLRTPFVTISIDSFHNGQAGVPLQNAINLTTAYRELFPDYPLTIIQLLERDTISLQNKFLDGLAYAGVLEGNPQATMRDYNCYGTLLRNLVHRIVFSHGLISLNAVGITNNREFQAFTSMLDQDGILEEIIGEQEGKCFFPTHVKVIAGQIIFLHGSICQLQRGKTLRKDRYFLGTLEQKSDRPTDKYLEAHNITLGWDGKFYANGMHASNGVLPIGSLEDGVNNAIDFANRDPIHQTLLREGAHYLFGIAKTIKPELSLADYSDWREFVIGVVGEPEFALAITRALMLE